MGKRILCIDDEEDILELMEFILTGEGYEVKSLLSPEDLFRQIRQFKPDLITLDIRLYSENGLEVCRAITNNPSTKYIPVIMISSHESVHTAIREYGATDIILKPFDLDSLINSVGKHLLAKVIPFSSTS